VKANYFNLRLRSDNPVEIVNEWLDGDPCPPSLYSNGTIGNLTTATCNLGAYPAYVVNITTVKGKQDPSDTYLRSIVLPSEATWGPERLPCNLLLIEQSLTETDTKLAVNFARNSNIRLITK
jgi:hypothetical protein